MKKIKYTFIVFILCMMPLGAFARSNNESLTVPTPVLIDFELENLVLLINNFDDGVFKNKKNINPLINKIDVVIFKVDNNKYEQAINKLENDVFKKIDSCSFDNISDKNDWIMPCGEQLKTYNSIIKVINLLKT